MKSKMTHTEMFRYSTKGSLYNINSLESTQVIKKQLTELLQNQLMTKGFLTLTTLRRYAWMKT